MCKSVTITISKIFILVVGNRFIFILHNMSTYKLHIILSKNNIVIIIMQDLLQHCKYEIAEPNMH